MEINHRCMRRWKTIALLDAMLLLRNDKFLHEWQKEGERGWEFMATIKLIMRVDSFIHYYDEEDDENDDGNVVEVAKEGPWS
jgi:hypothetical protein